MERRMTGRWSWTLGVGLVFAAIVGLAAPHALKAAPAAVPGEVTFTKDIAPILQRSCENCHRADGVAPMSLVDLRRGAAVGARHQAAHRHRPEGRRDAAVVRREEHRHPEVPERSVAERRRDRQDRASGPTAARRAATRPTCRRAKVYADASAWAIGTPDLIVKTQELTVKGDAPDWWGEIPSVADRPHRGSLRRRARDQGSQRRAIGKRRRATAPPSAAASSSTT